MTIKSQAANISIFFFCMTSKICGDIRSNPHSAVPSISSILTFLFTTKNTVSIQNLQGSRDKHNIQALRHCFSPWKSRKVWATKELWLCWDGSESSWRMWLHFQIEMAPESVKLSSSLDALEVDSEKLWKLCLFVLIWMTPRIFRNTWYVLVRILTGNYCRMSHGVYVLFCFLFFFSLSNSPEFLSGWSSRNKIHAAFTILEAFSWGRDSSDHWEKLWPILPLPLRLAKCQQG